MFRDFRQDPPGIEIEADFCIVGAGAAGISLARRLVGASEQVCLVESGGLEFDADVQHLSVGEIVGLPFPPLDVGRLRFFGGSTNHWTAQCRPLDEIDFQRRDWVPYSGWPFGREALEPYYRLAQSVCGLGPYQYDPAAWQQAGLPLLDLDTARLVNLVLQWGQPPLAFGEAYRAELERAANVTVLLNANLVHIDANETASEVCCLRLARLDGGVGSVRAQAYVLACGGIENPRLLLLSNTVEPNGLGNRHDLVGRFFMDHPERIAAYGITSELGRFVGYGDGIPVSGTHVRLSAAISPALQQRMRTLNSSVELWYGGEPSASYAAARQIARDIGDGRFPSEFDDRVLAILGDLDGLLDGVYHKVSGQSVLWLGPTTEQMPNPDSRVSLGDERDRLGLRRPRLDWQLTEFEKRSMRVICQTLGEELARLGVARTRLTDWTLDDAAPWRDLEWGHHHMGTTRMSEDPTQGVVDRNCKMHGVANLYVAGSSVFPTSGHANPTLTIVALALRLADHLKQEWSRTSKRHARTEH